MKSSGKLGHELGVPAMNCPSQQACETRRQAQEADSSPGNRTIEPVGPADRAVRAVRAQKKAPPKSDAVHLMPSEQGFSRNFSENSQKASDGAFRGRLLAVFLATSGVTPSGSGFINRGGASAFPPWSRIDARSRQDATSRFRTGPWKPSGFVLSAVKQAGYEKGTAPWGTVPYTDSLLNKGFGPKKSENC